MRRDFANLVVIFRQRYRRYFRQAELRTAVDHAGIEGQAVAVYGFCTGGNRDTGTDGGDFAILDQESTPYQAVGNRFYARIGQCEVPLAGLGHLRCQRKRHEQKGEDQEYFFKHGVYRYVSCKSDIFLHNIFKIN